MDREAFKQRMQNLKSYREQNPGKGYLDWKASLPDNLQDDSSYNLKRAYELGYEPEYIEEDRSYHLPTRDSETGEILKKPWHPTFLIGLQEDAKLGYYPQTVDGTTYTTTWEGNENPIYKYKDGGEIGDEEKQYLKNWYSQRRQYANSKAKYMNKQLDVIQKGFTTPDFAKTNLQHHIPYKGLDQIPITIDDNKVKSIDKNAKGYYHPNEGIVLSKDYRDPNRENLLHEMTHRLNKYGAATSKQIESIIKDQKVYDKGNYTDYLTRPEEIYSRLMEFRKLNNLDPLKVYGKPDIQKLRRTGKDADILNLFVDDNVILDLLNTTASVSNKNIIKAENGGEVPSTNKPTIVEPIPYKGKLYSDRYGKKYTEEQVYDYYNNGTDEIDRFTGGPLVRGLKPLLDLEDAANFTPVGDAVAAYDVYDAVSNRDWSGAGLAALGLVPFVPMTVKQFRSKYKGVTPKVKRQVPTVNRKAVDSQLDFEVEKKRRQNQYFSKAKNEGYEIVQRLTDDPEYLRRANQVKQQFGDDYITTYADLIQAYNEDPLKLPGIEFYNSTGKDKASMAATLESSNRFRNKQGPFPMLGEFNYRIDSSKTDLSGDVTLYEWNHLTDYMKNKAPLADGDSNMFYKMSKDISNKQIDNDYQYYSRPTEQKAYMNQVREYMFKNGMISKRGDNVDAKMLQNVLNSLSEIDSMKSAVRASKQFKNINKYTKWFNSIPLLGVGALGMYDYANTNE